MKKLISFVDGALRPKALQTLLADYGQPQLHCPVFALRICGLRTLSTAQSVSTQPAKPQEAYSLRVTLKAYEKRYIEHAGYTIRDLLVLMMRPKSYQSLPTVPELPCPYSNLYMTRSYEVVKQANPHYTTIRGPFAHKYGMEQFELRRLKHVIRAATNSSYEVQWFLDALKFYDFTGVQIEVTVTSANHLIPTSDLALDQPLLSRHKSSISRYLTEPTHNPSNHFSQQLSRALQTLSGVVYEGLEAERRQLTNNKKYQEWHNKHKHQQRAAVGRSQGADDQLDFMQSSFSEEVSQRLVQVKAALNKRQDSTEDQQALAFLTALDAVLLNFNFDSLENYNLFQYYFCFHSFQSKAPAAQHMHALLKYSQYMQKLGRMSQETKLIQAYTQYCLFSHTLLYSLFKLWFQKKSSEFKSQLALPTRQETVAFFTKLDQGAGKPEVQTSKAPDAKKGLLTQQ